MKWVVSLGPLRIPVSPVLVIIAFFIAVICCCCVPFSVGTGITP